MTTPTRQRKISAPLKGLATESVNTAVNGSTDHAVEKNAPVTLKVVRRLPNVHLVLCEPVSPKENPARVRVRDNTQFHAGMEISAVPIAENYYDHASWMPRSRSKW